jgi:beta-lactamase regulating signal transducer with metallopeptidase domain/tetratricopeptide (TPR) repeat protein
MGIIFLPAICLYGPKLTLAVLPVRTQVTEVAADADGIVLDVPVVEELSDEIYSPISAYIETTTEDNHKLQTFTTKNILTVLWLVGVVLMTARLMVGWYRLRRVCLSAEAVSENDRLWKRDVRILLTSQVQGPVCFGLFRGIILLPLQIYENTSADKLEMILKHELAHIERKDYLANLFQRIIEVILFFHPFIWYASLQLTQQREQICDNYVLADGASADDYTVLLTQIVEKAMHGDRLGAVALIEGRLLSRVRFLLNPNRSQKIKLSGWASVVTIAAFMTLLSFSTIRLKAMSLTENDQDYSKASYTIDCSINTAEGRLGGTEIIRFKNSTSEPLDRLEVKWFSGGNMEITSKSREIKILVETNGQSQSSSTFIEFSEPILPGKSADLQIKFNILAPAYKDVDKIAVGRWYPHLWRGFETHDDYKVKLSVPEEYVVVTSGFLNKKTGYYHAEDVRSFGLFLGKGFDSIDANAKNVNIRCIFTPNSRKCAELLLKTAVDVINFYRQRFGFYPSKCLTIIPGMSTPAGGYPVATNIVAVHGMEKLDSMPKYHWQWITAHEIGHQYCGEHILSKDPADSFDWLMIGLGIYADREYTQARNLSLAKHQGLMNRYSKGVRAGLDTTINITHEQQSKIQWDFNNVVVHGKSYSVISALDCVLGKETFSRIYQRCLKEFAGRRLGISDFQIVCEDESDQDLGWFFDQWVNSNKFLSYEISSKKCEKLRRGYKSEIEVKCLGNLKMPVPVAAYFEDGSSQIKSTNRLSNTDIIEFKSSAPLKEVRLDPANKLAMVIPSPTSNSKVVGTARQLPWSGAGEKALEFFKQAKRIQADVEVWFKLGLNLYDGGYYPEALESFRRINTAPNKDIKGELVSLVWQGHILDILKQRDAALECYHKALDLYSDSSLSSFKMRHDQWSMVIDRKWVEKRIKRPFQRPLLDEKELSKKIQQLPWTGAGKDALDVFNKVRESDLSNPANWFKLGLTLYDGRYYKEALEAFQQTREFSRKTSYQYPSSLVWQGHIFDLLGRRREALNRYEAVLQEGRDFNVRHDQYGIRINRDWVKERVTKPFERRNNKKAPTTKADSNLEVLDIKMEPIRQGKNVVLVKVKNTSDEDQILYIDIRTESLAGNWQTQFTHIIKGSETKWIRHAYKIYGSITADTLIRLQLYNPGPVESFDRKQWFSSKPWDKWFKKVIYFGDDLEHYQADEVQIKPASKSQTDIVIKTLRKVQNHIKNKEYKAAWGLFTQDFREAEFQSRGLERFKECMESPQRFYLGSKDLLSLEPRSVSKIRDILTLTTKMKGKLWGKTRIVNFIEAEGKWKIDSIEIGARTQIDSDKHKDAVAKKMVEGQAKSKIEVSDVEFKTIRQGKNVVRMRLKNNSDKDQIFGIDIRAEAPVRNWQRQFLDTIESNETKIKSFGFEILGPITDNVSIRLRFYNPTSVHELDINNWFKQFKYYGKDLKAREIVQTQSKPASKDQIEAVRKAFEELKSCLKDEKYEVAWELLTKHIRSSQYQDDFGKFKELLSADNTVRNIFLNLRPGSVTKNGEFLTLNAEDGVQTWKIHYIEEDGQWKINDAQEPDRSNWQERLLSTMQKRSTKHFDIYYFKDSTVEKEIEKITKEREKGFEKICDFLGKDSNQRIKMIFFENGETKRKTTGHQGAGWAFGNTIVEIYNRQQKLDPYHETVHILMRPFGNPPALFNEGFAVYMSERLGASSLRYLGGGESKIYERVKELNAKNELWELKELVGFTEIGSKKTRPPVAYPQAASFVKFLVETYGKERFLEVYKTLENWRDNGQNIERLERICNRAFPDLERQWMAVISR